jgi:probable FeS assembly SUF system protein SufT
MDEPIDSGPIILQRDVPAIMVPLGAAETLLQGTEVRITQRLGSHITVVFDGRMYRIDGCHADALGLGSGQRWDIPAPKTREEAENAVLEQLTTCYDPEIPVNIVELGLIYRLDVQSADASGADWTVDIDMTLTAPGCGMGTILTEEVYDKVRRIPGIARVNVELVWDPPWSLERMSDAARLQAGLW